MKGYLTVANTGRRIYVAGVFINPGETSGVLEIPANQVSWVLAKIRSREVFFQKFDASVLELPTSAKKDIALPTKKAAKTEAPAKKPKVNLPAVIPVVTKINLTKPPRPLAIEATVEVPVEVELEEVVTTEIEAEIEEVTEEVAEETTKEVTEDVAEEVAEEITEETYNEEDKREEYKGLLYNQLYAKCRAFDVEISGRPKKDELIELLIASKV